MFQEHLSANYDSLKNKLLKNLEVFDLKNASIEKTNVLLSDLNEFFQLISATKFNLEFNQNIVDTTISNNIIEEKIIDVIENNEKVISNPIATEEIKKVEINIEKIETSINIKEPLNSETLKSNNSDQIDTISSITDNITPVQPSQNIEKNTSVSENLIQHSSATNYSQNKTIKKIEFGINDKFRIINELFGQSQIEFNTAIEQLNSCVSIEESENYLNNLKIIYNWKSESQLVKTFFALNHKRFN